MKTEALAPAETLSALIYQIRGPRITTMGYCSRSCGNAARGGGVCAQCLTHDLDRAIGNEKAIAVLNTLRAAQRALWDAEDAIAALTTRKEQSNG